MSLSLCLYSTISCHVAKFRCRNILTQKSKYTVSRLHSTEIMVSLVLFEWIVGHLEYFKYPSLRVSSIMQIPTGPVDLLPLNIKRLGR